MLFFLILFLLVFFLFFCMCCSSKVSAVVSVVSWSSSYGQVVANLDNDFQQSWPEKGTAPACRIDASGVGQHFVEYFISIPSM